MSLSHLSEVTSVGSLFVFVGSEIFCRHYFNFGYCCLNIVGYGIAQYMWQ